MSENNTFPVDQNGALDLTTHQKAPIDCSKNSNNTNKTLTTSGKLTESLYEPINSHISNNFKLLEKKRILLTMNDSSSYTSMNLNFNCEYVPRYNILPRSSKGPSCFIPRGSNFDYRKNADVVRYIKGEFLQNLGNSSSSSNRPACFNSSVLSSSKLIKQIGMNDSSHPSSENPFLHWKI